MEHEGHSELAYILELPEIPGITQREFQIKKEASYIVSIKNPDIQALRRQIQEQIDAGGGLPRL